MSEDHSKYMPHHPKPKFGGGKGKPSLQDPMIRARAEPTSHDGSMDYNGPAQYDGTYLGQQGMQ